jgi:hypothetical protein
MENIIESEYNEFKKYHKSQFNLYFHIICGIFFMTFLLLSLENYKNIGLIIYAILLTYTIKDTVTIIFTISILYFFVNVIFKNYNLSKVYSLVLFFIFYLLPDLSHYISNEKTVLTINNVTILTGFINIFYLLPFSFICLGEEI